jgi:hypothetical protein
MPDFLTTLAQRTLKTVPVIQPMIAPLFSPDLPEASAPVEEETWNTPAHTKEVSLNRVEASPSTPHNGRVFGNSGVENGAKVGVRGGVERGGGLGLTLAESESTGKTGKDSGDHRSFPSAKKPTPERPDAQPDEPPVSALGQDVYPDGPLFPAADQGAHKVTPLPSSPHVQKSLETDTRNDTYPKDYRNITTNLPIWEKEVEGTNPLPEQFELVQHTGMAMPLNNTVFGEEHRTPDRDSRGKGRRGAGRGPWAYPAAPGMAIPLNSRFFGEEHGIADRQSRGKGRQGAGRGPWAYPAAPTIETGETGNDGIPGKGKPKAPAPLHASPYPYSGTIFEPHKSVPLRTPASSETPSQIKAAEILPLTHEHILDDNSTLFSTEIAPFHPLQSTNVSGSPVFGTEPDRDNTLRMTTSTALNATASDEPMRSHTPPAPAVHITIGRIDVRAITTQTPETRRSPSKTRSSLSLDDYMNKQNKGER